MTSQTMAARPDAPETAEHRPTPTSARRSRLRSGLVLAAGLVALGAAWTVTLRPQSLGGPASYVMVRGMSMLPTYHHGDLVILRRANSYSKGDVVGYRIPRGQIGQGLVVIHRIVGGSAPRGFVMRGDNNAAPDDWHPTPRDIVGKPWVRVPRVGVALAFLHAPLPLAGLGSGMVAALLLVPRERTVRPGRLHADREPVPDDDVHAHRAQRRRMRFRQHGPGDCHRRALRRAGGQPAALGRRHQGHAEVARHGERDLLPPLPRDRARPAQPPHFGHRFLRAVRGERDGHGAGDHGESGGSQGQALLVPGRRAQRLERRSGGQRDGRSEDRGLLGSVSLIREFADWRIFVSARESTTQQTGAMP